MKKVFLLLLCPLALFSQTKIFNVETIETNLPWNESGFYKLKNHSPYFFEDENYSVTSECHGEFGGKLFFRDKKTGDVNIAYATCPVIMHKIDNKYLLTTSLSHLLGFYGIYEIENPKELTLQVKNGKEYNNQDGKEYNNQDLLNGMKQLADGMEKTILISFSYKDELYHIISDHEKNECYVAILENAVLKKIQSITKLKLQALSIETLKTEDGCYAARFSIVERDRLRTGYITIIENNIKIYLNK